MSEGHAPSIILNPAVRVIICGDDELLVLHGLRSQFRRTIKDSGRSGLLGPVVRALRSPHTPQSLTKALGDGVDLKDLDNLVRYLLDEGVAVPEQEVPSRSYAKLVLRANGTPPRPIAVVGEGRLYERVLEEFERVPGVDAGAVSQDDARGAMEAGKLVVALADTLAPSLFHELDQASLTLGAPWMSAFMDGSEGFLGPLYVPGDSCNYNDFAIQVEAGLALAPGDYPLYEEDVAKSPEPRYTLPPHVSALAALVAGAAITFSATGKSHLLGRCVRYDFERLRVDYEEVLRIPRTPTRMVTTNGYRHVYM
jgi:hypothetical protein